MDVLNTEHKYLGSNLNKRSCCNSPPFVNWAQGFSTQTVGEDLFFWSSPNFGPKSGLNLSEDLFLFLSSLNVGQENGLILGGKFLTNFLIFLAPAPPPPPPPFENPAYATGSVNRFFILCC